MKPFAMPFTLVAALMSAAPALAEPVVISAADCRALVAHVPSADATYQPGVDVRGKAVVPADLGGAPIDLPATIDIQLNVDVARRLGARGTEGSNILSSRKGLEGLAPLGKLTVKGNDVFWNGRQIQSQDEAALAAACRAGLRAKGIVLPEAKPAAPTAAE